MFMRSCGQLDERVYKRSERESLTVLHNQKIIEIIAEMNQP